MAEMNETTDGDERNLREELAAYAHDTWSGWMRYMFSKVSNTVDQEGAVTIPSQLARRWLRQMETAYADLPENERESDLKEADKIIQILYASVPSSRSILLNSPIRMDEQ